MGPRAARFAGGGLALLGRITHRTARLQISGLEDATRALQSQRPVIFTAWHGQTHLLFPFLLTYADPSRLAVLTPDDERGAVLGITARALGARPFPISMEDESLAAARRTLAFIRELHHGAFAYLTPDGPDGPARVAKEGLAFIAARSEADLLAMGAFTATCYRLRRWDRYALPLPFSRIAVAIRAPIRVEKGIDRPQSLTMLSREMTRAMVEAENLYQRGR